MTDRQISPLLESLRDEIAATSELPIDRRSNRWLGEAQAVAEDIADRPASESTIERRINDIRYLLEQIDDCGNETANRHVSRALDLVDRIDRRL